MAFCLGNVKIGGKEGKRREGPSPSILDGVRGQNH